MRKLNTGSLSGSLFKPAVFSAMQLVLQKFSLKDGKQLRILSGQGETAGTSIRCDRRHCVQVFEYNSTGKEPKGLSELEEGVNIQHCESGICISREISVRPSIQKAEMGMNRLLPTGFLAKVNNKK